MNARLYDFVLSFTERSGLAERRASLLKQADGDVLEIGAGTGLNFGYYPSSARVVAIEPDPAMARRAIERARSARASVKVFQLDAQRLSVEDESIDVVVGTLVMCTIPDPSRALAELRRVLRPGGRYLFIEHVRSESLRLARWQDRLERPWGLLGGGCHPNRRTVDVITATGFKVGELDRFEIGFPLTKPHVAGDAFGDSA
ncbi:MAG: class I SAM-dependent methyltransferase [Actinomycetota bacterium]